MSAPTDEISVPTTSLSLSYLSRLGEGGSTALHCAAADNRSDLVTLLLDHGAKVESLDQGRDTPLHWACRNIATDACKALLEKGADVNRAGKDAWTGLRELFCQRLDLCQNSENVGTIISSPRSTTICCAQLPYESLTADFAALNKEGRKGAVELIDLLLSKGADPRARTRDGLAPWAVVAQGLKRGGKIADQDDEVRDILQEAEENKL